MKSFSNRPRIGAGLFLAGLVMTTLSPREASGHFPSQTSTRTNFFLHLPKITIDCLVEFGELRGEPRLIAADTDRDGKLSGKEKEEFVRKLSDEIRANLKIFLDGDIVKLNHVNGTFAAPGNTGHLQVTVELKGDLDVDETGSHSLEITQNVMPGQTVEDIMFRVRAGAKTETSKALHRNNQLRWEFDYHEDLVGDTVNRPFELEKPKKNESESTWEIGNLKSFVRRENLGPAVIFIALLVATGLGAIHALSPGHGKSLVAAYLIGSRGKIREAVFLGGIVALTHISCIFVLGLVILALSQYMIPEQIYPWIGFASGCLVFTIGIWMLAARARGLVSRTHSHENGHPRAHEHHDHSHRHHHLPDPEKHSGWQLLSLGISGGMVPCPAALVILLAAVATHRLIFGLALIIAFGVGLAVMLMLLGILVVTSARFLQGFGKNLRLIKALPVLSACLIILAGLWIAAVSLLAEGIISIRV